MLTNFTGKSASKLIGISFFRRYERDGSIRLRHRPLFGIVSERNLELAYSLY